MGTRAVKAGYLAFGQAVGTLCVILVAAVLSRLLDKEEYATYRQTLLAFRFVAPLIALGIPAALMYFLPNEDQRKRGVLLEALFVLGVMGAVFGGFLLCGGNSLLAGVFNNPKLEASLFYFAPYALLVLPALALSPCLVACGYPRTVAVYTVLSQGLLCALVICWVYGNPVANQGVRALILHSGIVLLPAILLMCRATANTRAEASPSGTLRMLRYSVPLGFGAMVAVLNINVDKVIVSIIGVPAQYAVYVNGAFEVPLIAAITGAASSVILPDIVSLLKRGDRSGGVEIWKRAAVKSAAILFPMTGVLWLLAPDLLVVVFGQTYLESTPIFRVYLLMLPIRIVYFSIIYQAYGKSMLILGRSLLALFLNVILSVPLALWIGPIGAALSTVIISWGIMVPFNARSVSKMTGFSIRQLFLWSKLGGVVLSSLLTVAVAWGVSEFLPASAPVRLLVLGSGSLILILLCHALFRVWGWQQQKQFAEAAVQKLLYILKRK